jgi:hypothetical protein
MRRVMLAPFLPLTLADSYMRDRVLDTVQTEGIGWR